MGDVVLSSLLVIKDNKCAETTPTSEAQVRIKCIYYLIQSHTTQNTVPLTMFYALLRVLHPGFTMFCFLGKEYGNHRCYNNRLIPTKNGALEDNLALV